MAVFCVKGEERQGAPASLVLMVGPAVNILFMDLWRLGQRCRAVPFIGLAAELILVSLYQRFRTGKDEEK